MEISIDELRQRLGIGEEQYQLVYQLKIRVLDAAVKQIKEHTEWKVSYSDIKHGAKIVAFKFTIKPKNIAPPKKERKPTFDEFLLEKANAGESRKDARARLWKIYAETYLKDKQQEKTEQPTFDEFLLSGARPGESVEQAEARLWPVYVEKYKSQKPAE